VFSPYKDVTVSMNWNTNVISTAVTGSLVPFLTAAPSNLKALTWAFATGECGSENWAGITPSALASANVQSFVSTGKFYIISTGGADGTFTCGSDSGFTTFINTYNSSNLLGIDFDIEGGQSQSDITNLVQRVITAERSFPNLRFSFTIATLGGNAPNSLNSLGQMVVQTIQSMGLTKYTINLMAMDFGGTSASNCTIVNGGCEMGQSAIAAAENLHSFYGVPYANIELTPMIGGNDTQADVFTIPDVSTISTYAAQKGLAGIHFWSFDRDDDCAPGSASPTCNSYGQAGTLGFTRQFLSSLGQ
jgi:chitinase